MALKNPDTPSKRAWKKFRRNIPAMIGMGVIIIAAIFAIFGYLIVPDNTTHANQQAVELKLKPPGFKIDVLYVRLSQEEPESLLKLLWEGRERNYRIIPIINYHFEGDEVIYEQYAGSEEEGIVESISLSEVVARNVTPAEIAQVRQEIKDQHIDSRLFILGTDGMGRDYFSRLILGTRVSLAVGVMAVILSLIIGIFFGSIAGYFRGWIDDAVIYVINVFWSIPTLLLALSLALVLEQGLWQVFIAIGLTMWIELARIVRGQIMVVREMEYVEAASSLGFAHRRIIFRHILPNIMGPVTVILAANFAAAILLEAGLSFLGLGVERPMPSWGMMLSDNRTYLIAGLPHLAIIPGIAICILVLSFFMIGNGLRDAFDVKTKLSY